MKFIQTQILTLKDVKRITRAKWFKEGTKLTGNLNFRAKNQKISVVNSLIQFELVVLISETILSNILLMFCDLIN